MNSNRISPDFERTLLELRSTIHRSLMEHTNASYPASLYQPIKYFLEIGGKRLRPSLTLLACRAVGGRIEDALSSAVAIELLHNFTLVHDDIMDQDDLRRGHPTVHKRWNEAVAILSGDGLIGLAYRALLNSPADTIHRVMRIFTEGVIKVCEGQAIDKDFEERPEVSLDQYFDMIEKKTGALISIATEIGGIIAKAEEKYIEALREYGALIGRAFQIQDDILDITSTEQVLGKNLGSDLSQGKKTFAIVTLKQTAPEPDWRYVQKVLKNREVDEPTLIKVREILRCNQVLERAETQVAADIEEARECLRKIDGGSWGKELIEFSKLILNRKH